MGEAKRRGSHEDRVRQSKEASELVRIMELQRKEKKMKEEQERFDALPPEVQQEITERREAVKNQQRRIRLLLAALMGASAGGMK